MGSLGLKLLDISIILFSNAPISAQNIQLHRDFGKGRNYFTSTVTMFKPDNLGSTFFFIDMNYDNSVMLSYWELAREFKFAKSPINIHVEYNGGLTNSLSFGNAYLLGPSFAKNSEDFSKGISFMVLYKYIENTSNNKPHNFQFTIVWHWNFMNNKMSFLGFADFWKQKGFGNYIFISEPQIWYNVAENISIGSEVEFSNNFVSSNFEVMPTLAVKWSFK